MPFKVTALRLETIADIAFVLGLLIGIFLMIVGEIFSGILCLIVSFLFSYLLYAIAKILQNTENILEYLKDTKYLKNRDEKDDDNEE